MMAHQTQQKNKNKKPSCR